MNDTYFSASDKFECSADSFSTISKCILKCCLREIGLCVDGVGRSPKALTRGVRGDMEVMCWNSVLIHLHIFSFSALP
jgi:hypothetical protein